MDPKNIDEKRLAEESEVSFFVRHLPAIIIAIVAVSAIICASLFMGYETIMAIAVVATALPGIILLLYIYRSDKIEPEPAGLLFLVFMLGLLVSLPALLIKELLFHIPSVTLTIILVAVVEEVCKYIVLRLGTWNHSAFNYRFDGVVYGATVAIGFEVAQAVLYLSGNISSTSFARFVIPVHCIFGIYMGFFYGQARAKENSGDSNGARVMEVMAVVFTVVLHFIYEMLTMQNKSITMTMIFVVFIIILNVAAWISVCRFSAEDKEIAK